MLKGDRLLEWLNIVHKGGKESKLRVEMFYIDYDSRNQHCAWGIELTLDFLCSYMIRVLFIT